MFKRDELPKFVKGKRSLRSPMYNIGRQNPQIDFYSIHYP